MLHVLGSHVELSEEEINSILDAYEDKALIPDWARQSTALSIKHGIIEGEGHVVNPQATLTRAQAAAIAIRLDQWITK
ncbi:hypothetical protein D3C73_825310 [compost metagenome]